MSDADRALLSRKHRQAPPLGVPISQLDELDEAAPLDPAPNEEITTPHDLELRFGQLSAKERYFAERMEEVRKAEAARNRKAQDTADKVLEAIGNVPPMARFQMLEGRLVDLEKDLAKFFGRLAWAFRLAVGAAGAAAIKLVLVIRAFDAVEARSEFNAARVQLLEQVIFLRSQAKDVTP